LRGRNDYSEVLVYHPNSLNPDSDGDGYNDYAKIYSGHSPLDANDHPAENLSVFTAIELDFIRKTNTSYFIQAYPNIVTRTNCEGPILGNGNIWKKTYSIRGAGKMYYQVPLAP
jgi:hypothetical protein